MKSFREFLGTTSYAYGGQPGTTPADSSAPLPKKSDKEEKLKRLPEEDSYKVDIEVGDEVKVGKFKNRKTEVKGFDTDDKGQPVLKTSLGDQKLFKPRISKLDVDEDKNVFGENPFRVWKNAMDKDLTPKLGD